MSGEKISRPIHNSLTAPLTLAGVPHRFAMLNGTVCIALVLGFHFFYLLPFFIATHAIAMYFTKKDPYFFEILIRYIRYKRYYLEK